MFQCSLDTHTWALGGSSKTDGGAPAGQCPLARTRGTKLTGRLSGDRRSVPARAPDRADVWIPGGSDRLIELSSQSASLSVPD